MNYNDRLLISNNNWTPSWEGANDFLNRIKYANAKDQFMTGIGSTNPSIPAGYTYFGQLLAHELTFDLQTLTDLDGNRAGYNFRNSKIDLESIYGNGPLYSPIFYDQGINLGRTHFLIEDGQIPRKSYPSTSSDQIFEMPLLVDMRNEENIIVLSLQLAIMSFHNRVVEVLMKRYQPLFQVDVLLNKLAISGALEEAAKSSLKAQFAKIITGQNLRDYKVDGTMRSPGLKSNGTDLAHLLTDFLQSGKMPDQKNGLEQLKAFMDHLVFSYQVNLYDKIFQEAKRETCLHFQWILLYDYLPKIVGSKTMEAILGVDNGYPLDATFLNFKLLADKPLPFLPEEFSSAAFRFGHSMVRDDYVFTSQPRKQEKLFQVKKIYEKPRFEIDWNLFFFTPDMAHPNANQNYSLLINPLLTPQMTSGLPHHYASRNIVFRNLKRGIDLKMASGQHIARNFLEEDQVIYEKSWERNGQKSVTYLTLEQQFLKLGLEEEFSAFCNDTPLWAYVLMEAELHANGRHLGALGGRIVGEVLVGVLVGDKDSIFYQRQPSGEAWQPQFFNENELQRDNNSGDFSALAFLKFAGLL